MRMKEIPHYKPKLGISACQLGNAVRFDAGHKRDVFLTDTFSQYVEWISVCPEIALGIGLPREPVRLVGNLAEPRMIAERSGKDWTSAMRAFAIKRAKELKRLDLSGYVFKKTLQAAASNVCEITTRRERRCDKAAACLRRR